jgi:putative ABC transport system permease protein
MGIRMALGAARWQVVGMVLREGAGLSAAGIAIGIAGALAMRRIIAGWLYGVGPADPVTFVVAPVLIFGVSLVACLIPARRAASVDPAVALRYE